MEVTPSQTLYVNNINEKIKKDSLKKTLYALFSQYGKVIEIVACKGIRLRGQAWIVYQDTSSATNAMRRLQGFNFFDKPLRITFAKEKSDIVAKKDGTFNPRQKRVREEKAPEERRAPAPPTQQSATPAPVKAPKPIVNNIPHRILFAQNLPDECNDQMLATLFQQYPGFQEVRMVPGKKGIAFVEFQDVVQAGIAMQQLNGFQLSASNTLNLTYGKQ